jgi:hypothetical protein
MLFFGLKDIFYIAIIIIIIIHFKFNKKDKFTTSSTNNISLTESIKNLGIIAKDMINNEYISIYGLENLRIPQLDTLDNIITFTE